MKNFIRKLSRLLLGVLILVVLVAIGGIWYLNSSFPVDVPVKNLKIEAIPEVLARGEYLVKNVTICLDCHSKTNLTYFAAPIIPGTEGMGGDLFPGAPGALYTSNITPAALGSWSDGEIARAIVSGLDKDNEPLAPIMPYTEYRYMSESDLAAIVAYLRTLEPIPNSAPIPEPNINFPVDLIFRTLPGPPEHQALPDSSNTIATGKYYARIAGCIFCHTPMKGGQPDTEMLMAGGHEFPLSETHSAISANITPDKDTGIGSWTKEAFINRFKAYADSGASRIPVTGELKQTSMPWLSYANMAESDLSAIYDYLQTVKPVRNAVAK